MKLFIASRNAEIKEVDFPAELGPSYVYASSAAIEEAVDRFLGIEASGGTRGTLDEGERKSKKKGRSEARAEAKPKPKLARRSRRAATGWCRPAKRASRRRRSVDPQGQRRLSRLLPDADCPPGRPTRKANPELHIQDPRVYHFKDTDGNRHGAYRMVLTLELPDGVHYFGVQGIQGWSDPPILGGPSITETIRDREYEIFLDGDRVRLVAWHRGDNTYWVANSLLRVLTNDQMIGIARSARVKIPNRSREQRRAAR